MSKNIFYTFGGLFIFAIFAYIINQLTFSAGQATSLLTVQTISIICLAIYTFFDQSQKMSKKTTFFVLLLCLSVSTFITAYSIMYVITTIQG